MQPFDSEFIREQRALAEKATPRPWTRWNYQPYWIIAPGGRNIASLGVETCKSDEYNATADYLCAACNSYPAALNEIERLTAKVTELEYLDAEGTEAARIMTAENKRLHAEVERLKAESEWELVRVPDNTDDVLAVDDLGVVFIATYIPETGKWYDNDGELSTKGECPIGWRKLPAAPRSEK